MMFIVAVEKACGMPGRIRGDIGAIDDISINSAVLDAVMQRFVDLDWRWKTPYITSYYNACTLLVAVRKRVAGITIPNYQNMNLTSRVYSWRMGES